MPKVQVNPVVGVAVTVHSVKVVFPESRCTEEAEVSHDQPLHTPLYNMNLTVQADVVGNSLPLLANAGFLDLQSTVGIAQGSKPRHRQSRDQQFAVHLTHRSVARGADMKGQVSARCTQ